MVNKPVAPRSFQQKERRTDPNPISWMAGQGFWRRESRNGPLATSPPPRQAAEFVFAQWFLALDREAFGPFAGKIPLQPPVYEGRHPHRQQCPKAGQSHVLVRIPFVPLGAEIRLAQVTAKKSRHRPFQQLVDHRGRHGQVERQEIAPKPAHIRHAQEHFPNRVGQQQAVGKMDHAIEIVPLPADHSIERPPKQRLPPAIVRHFRIGVVRAQLVQAEEDKDQRIGKMGEPQTPIQDGQRRHRRHGQRVFHQPIASVVRMDRQHRPPPAINGGQDQIVASMGSRHARD